MIHQPEIERAANELVGCVVTGCVARLKAVEVSSAEIKAASDELAALCRKHGKAASAEAFGDALDAAAMGMDKIAAATLRASMVLAGRAAADEFLAARKPPASFAAGTDTDYLECMDEQAEIREHQRRFNH